MNPMISVQFASLGSAVGVGSGVGVRVGTAVGSTKPGAFSVGATDRIGARLHALSTLRLMRTKRLITTGRRKGLVFIGLF
jgi:hypothetical protein